MIHHDQTTVVYISSLLRQQYPAVVSALKDILGESLQEIDGTKDIWCRDYMPVQLDTHRFVQFRYDPDYLNRNSSR
jgi:hypothetical protein